MRKILVVVCLAMSLAMQSVSAVSADEIRPSRVEALRAIAEQVFSDPDPEAAYAALPRAVQDELDEFGMATSVKSGMDIALMALPADGLEVLSAEKCWLGTGYTYAENAFGHELWRYYLQIIWCISNGKVVRGGLWDRWAETKWPGWRFKGHLQTDFVFHNNTYRRYTQGEFAYGAGGWDIQHMSPCTQLRGQANAWYTVHASCNLFA